MFAYLRVTTIPSLKITILADNDFYSQSSMSYSHLKSLPRFNPLNKSISKVNKTGLGSSAALITALVASLLNFFGADISSDDGKMLVHNLAQIAHCAAQGKVGSGFDVAAAVYGSCIYRRFRPEIIQEILLDAEEYDEGFQIKLSQLVEKKWDMEVIPFQLPTGLRVVMGDVTAGSETPSMVRSVLKWKGTNPQAEQVWNSLGAANKALIEAFNDLKNFKPDDIISSLRQQDQENSSNSIRKAIKVLEDEFDVISLHELTDLEGNSYKVETHRK